MTREEAISIIRKEYLCVDRDCDIERSCGKCDLMMPNKEPILQAYKLAIKALEQEPRYYPFCEDCHKKMDEIRKAYDKIQSAEPKTDSWSIKDVADTFKKHGLIREQEPCDDAISRQAALNVADYTDYIGLAVEDVKKVTDAIVKELKCLPSVTPKQRTGHWILLEHCSNAGYYCSECHKKVVKEGWSNTVKIIKYCPNCGAKMVESEDKNDICRGTR